MFFKFLASYDFFQIQLALLPHLKPRQQSNILAKPIRRWSDNLLFMQWSSGFHLCKRHHSRG